ncbi:hypothetical protein BBK36DRAFT_1176323 [Trichoderma citrinoviride]|uniref:Uncharacterized protein n=1 Tax=Trichoderma citrinoviride TaxID=58853 RepID=A0A2T4BNW7_9HYPO|nr:hypothetical protein BBK36DRAFT_1176323 [Trichoderma citrinoviride]PTB71014.1 hypothetical protein BBK36DRAFT_1176323 [Trichoderma citrinoviride]
MGDSLSGQSITELSQLNKFNSKITTTTADEFSVHDPHGSMQANTAQAPHAPDEATFVTATKSRLRRLMRSRACSLRFRRRRAEDTVDMEAAEKASKEEVNARIAQSAMEDAMEEMNRTLAMWDWDKIKREMDREKLGTLEEALNSHPLPWT